MTAPGATNVPAKVGRIPSVTMSVIAESAISPRVSYNRPTTMPTDKTCPECHRRFRWYDNECADCHVALVDATDNDPTPDVEIVPVFSTTDMALLPLAQMELEGAGILYETKPSRGTRMTGFPKVAEDDAMELAVRAVDVDRARELLADLEHAAPIGVAEPAQPPATVVRLTLPSPADAPVALFDKDTGLPIGRLTIAQFDDLDAKLEHESEDDDDFYVDEPTIAMLEGQGVEAAVVELLRHALAGRSGMDVRWVEE